MTTHTTYYQPEPALVPSLVPALLARVYAAAGLTAPSTFEAIDALIAAEPTPDTVADTAAAAAIAALGDDDFDWSAWLDDTIAATTRAAAVQTIQRAVGLRREGNLAHAQGALVAACAAAVGPTFTDAVTALTAAGTALPAADPLNPGQAFQLDLTVEHKAAASALATIGTIGSLWPAYVTDLGTELGALIRVVSVPPIEGPQPVNRITRAPVGEVDPRRAEVADLAHVAQRNGLDVAILEVARGRWDSLTLATPSDLAERVRHALNALSTVAVDT